MRRAAFAVAALLAAGCTIQVKLPYEPPPGAAAAQGNAVDVDVTDDRKDAKSPAALGMFRSGGGMKLYPAVTQDKVPLADVIKADLRKELASLGFAERGPPARKLAVSIQQWDFDGYNNTRVWYDFRVTVSNAAGQVIVQSQVKDETELKGHVMSGAMEAVRRELPELYGEVIQSLVRKNPPILGALASK